MYARLNVKMITCRLKLCNRKGKGKEEYLHSAIYYACIVSKRSDMDHTFLPANYTVYAFHSYSFTRWHHL